MTLPFKAWPKIPRYQNETFTITEKIDGTNACVAIHFDCGIHTGGAVHRIVSAQSRSKIITPGKQTDNYGFAAWVKENEQELLKLGEGYHYGEWWGNGIQRGYDQTQKRFSLFAWYTDDEHMPACCDRVPVFSKGTTIEQALEELKTNGSKAAPGYMRPEGLVVRSNHYGNALYKVIIDK